MDNTKKFNIFKIKWNRIIVDEAHEVLKTHPSVNSEITSIIHGNFPRQYNGEFNYGIEKKERLKYSLMCKLKSNFKWCLTATPFKEQLNNLYSYINFLNSSYTNQLTKYVDEIDRMNNIDLFNYLKTTEKENPGSNGILCNGIQNAVYGLNINNLSKLLINYSRCNTKKDIKGVVNIPIFTEEITYLTQNSIERNIYLEALRYNNNVRLFHLCTHLLVSNEVVSNSNFGSSILDLNEIQKIMVNKYKKEIAQYKKEISNNNSQNEKIKEKEELFKLLISLEKLDLIYIR